MFINIENIQYNGFENMCKTCMVTCNLKPLQDNVIIQVLHNLTGALFQINDELPQQICIKCFDKLHEIHAFTSQCKQSNMHLIEYLNNFKNNSNKIEIKEEIIKEPYVKGGILENDLNQIESVQEETEANNLFMEELHIKSENIDEPSSINTQEHEDDSLNDCHEESSVIENKCEDFPFTCETCSKTFSTPTALREHSIIHSDDRPYVCKTCDKSFKRSTNLAQHRLIHSGIRHKCDVCTKAFVQSYDLVRHKKIHTGERAYSCDTCGKKFTESTLLNRHIRTHTGERPYQCDQCDTSFTQSNALRRHKWLHSGERPYQCEICPKAFIRSMALVRHIQSHGGEHPFKCQVCSKSFFKMFLLNEHQRVHTGEKPFKCDVCNKAFYHSSGLNRHKKVHVRDKMEVGEQTTSD